jgi:hypothetical protein
MGWSPARAFASPASEVASRTSLRMFLETGLLGLNVSAGGGPFGSGYAGVEDNHNA